MNDCRYDEKLQDLFDGALAADEETSVARHLEECAACKSAWDDLLALRAAAADLPPGIAPGEDLWPGIADRLDEPAAGADADDGIIRPEPARWFGLGRNAWLSAAAIAAFAILAGLQMRDGPASGPYADLASGYSVVREDCRAGLRNDESTVPVESRTTIDESLGLIEQAIKETQNALDKVTSAPEQANRLVAGYHKKMDLLKRLAHLASQ
jgi:hypothetical protein